MNTPSFDSWEDVPQQTPNQPSMEDYNPDDMDLPYIPSMPSVQQNTPPAYIDINNIQSYSARSQPQKRNQPNAYKNYALNEGGGAPVFDASPEKAEQNLNKMTDILKKVNGQIEQTDPDDVNLKQYAIGVAIKSMRDAIRMLQEVDYWIPTGKEEYANKLKVIGSPIAKALNAYVNKVETLK
jgi:hypothetical protein